MMLPNHEILSKWIYVVAMPDQLTDDLNIVSTPHALLE